MLAAASPERKDALPSPEGTDTPSVARPIPPERRGALDQAALDTLPKIPPDRPDEIELSVPVEYYIR